MPQDIQGGEGSPRSQSIGSIVEEFEGDLFEAPENAILIHACNCLGSWGAGIAKSFKIMYPVAYKMHHEHCKTTPTQNLIGRCQLIPPQEWDYNQAEDPPKRNSKHRKGKTADESGAQADTGSQRHWIACIFTSVGYGKPTKTHAGMDKPEVILENTRKALVDLKEQLVKLQVGKGVIEERGDSTQVAFGGSGSDVPGELWSCKFNSGLFAVEWADTRKVLEEELRSLGRNVRVVSSAKP